MTVAIRDWLRVTRRRTCPVCGKPDWCLIRPDGSAAICARIESPRKAGETGWLHRLKNKIPLCQFHPVSPRGKEAARASPDVLDKVYRTLLAEMQISISHRENLQRHGLSPEEIEAGGYKTLPRDGRPDIVSRLTARVRAGELPPPTGVPGFYMVAGDISYPNLAGPVGILIPERTMYHDTGEVWNPPALPHVSQVLVQPKIIQDEMEKSNG